MTRTSPPCILRRALLAGLALVAASSSTLAVDYTWSPGGVFGIAGSGTWSTAVANWSDNGTTFVNWQNALTNRAVFQGADGTPGQYVVAVAGNYNVQGITINTDGYRFESTVPATQRTITLASGGSFSIAAGKTVSSNNVRFTAGGNMSLTGGGTLRLEAGANFSNNAAVNIGTNSSLILDGANASGQLSTMSNGSTLTIQHFSSTFNQTTTGGSNGLRMEGTSTINLDAGTLSAYRIYSNAPVNTVVNLNGGTLLVRAGTPAANFLSVNNAYIEEGGVTFNTNGVNTTTSQVLQHGGVAATDGGLTKTGEGSLTLSGNSTYTGTTTVNAGTLLVNGSLAATAAVIVNSGGAFGGSGSVSGPVTVSGTLAPGSSIESLSTGAASFEDGSTLAVELNSSVALGVGSDLLLVNGNLSLDGDVELTLTDLAAVPVAFVNGTIFSLINYSGTWDGGLFTVGGDAILNGGTFTAGLNTWQLNYTAVTGGSNFSGEYLPASNFVNIVAVPEPSAVALLTGGLCAVMFFGRNRRRLS